MNGVGLPTVGRLLGHRKRATTAIYAHLDDAALQDAAAQAAAVIAGAMGYRAAPPPLPDEAHGGGDPDWPGAGDHAGRTARSANALRLRSERDPPGRAEPNTDPWTPSGARSRSVWPASRPRPGHGGEGQRPARRPRGWIDI